MAKSSADDRAKTLLLKRLGTNVRLYREQLQWTQERLAEEASLAPRTVQKIEAGQLNILVSTLSRLSRAMRCSSSELLDK